MLQFWKKSGHKEKINISPIRNDSNSPTHSRFDENASNIYEDQTKNVNVNLLEDEGLSDTEESDLGKDHSRLSKTLQEVFSDRSALDYFVQFLDSKDCSSLIHCWLDIEDFKACVDREIRHRKRRNGNGCSQKFLSPARSIKIDHDSLSVSTDGDSFTIDSCSLTEFSSLENKPKIEEINCSLHDENCKKSDSKLEILNIYNHDTTKKDGSSSNTDDPQDDLTETALRIFKKYISLEADENINCSEDIRKDVIENICTTEKLVDPDCFTRVQNYIYEMLDKEYFNSFLNSDYFCRHQIDVLTSGNVTLEDILFNETALFYFMEFLEQENQRHLLEFWIAASNFQQQLRDQKDFLDPAEVQGDAVVLYDKYFSLQAHCPLGFSDKVRLAVEQSICGENGVNYDCFHLPLKIVEKYLEKNYFKNFLCSQLYYKYLSELINAVQNSCSHGANKHKRTPSDCSSEKSFSTTTTFLAMENPNNKWKTDKKAADMNIDTRQLYDPDALWKRRKKHRLSLGRVNALGRYEPDFEPDPGKKSESKLRNVVRKFVNLDEDKQKEEMAWQVAEMIIKDITSITLNEQKPS
ncbi:A-kinase anchor protein 10, mitochondrial [Agrilus planipennis]|uniref:A-kinase anchor protein 10, mitochondrial n=1 Tax=Agrilus planipennis TaxID=224129 RepID=A0A1W4XWN7_AGRPL|nr:A-kinase anchor protein 10, mitochondrial [Agrilus planipennis]